MDAGIKLHAHYVSGIVRDGEHETVILLSSNDEAAYEATGGPGHLVAAVLEENSQANATRLAACWNAMRNLPTDLVAQLSERPMTRGEAIVLISGQVRG